jgi:hypothetical protein
MSMRTDFKDVLHLEPDECAARFKRNVLLHIPDESTVATEGIDLSRNVALQFFPVPVVEGEIQVLTFTLKFPKKDRARGTILVQDELHDLQFVRNFEADPEGGVTFKVTVPECHSSLRLAILPPDMGREIGPIPVPTLVHVTSNASNKAFFIFRFWHRRFMHLAESVENCKGASRAAQKHQNSCGRNLGHGKRERGGR